MELDFLGEWAVELDFLGEWAVELDSYGKFLKSCAESKP